MILMGADEGVKRDEAIAARTILHHYRLAPARGQTLGKQTGCGIAGAASAKRQDEAHRRVGNICCAAAPPMSCKLTPSARAASAMSRTIEGSSRSIFQFCRSE